MLKNDNKAVEDYVDDYNECFDKVFYGYSIIEEIGLDKVINKAPRFRQWIERIEGLVEQK
ncbi:MAG: Unknown protein [uncultured Sulfurovum sp.]|uniref:Uncharacterized protein n=1 Tax=uncultured Sulfurovum sp. TaxID=269237 RepID=A0A6S6U1A1_9BACT|nr:MAG: Unknown protein [uncultured Sulfurovum sp.]